jgi:hypothetical protein
MIKPLVQMAFQPYSLNIAETLLELTSPMQSGTSS